MGHPPTPGWFEDGAPAAGRSDPMPGLVGVGSGPSKPHAEGDRRTIQRAGEVTIGSGSCPSHPADSRMVSIFRVYLRYKRFGSPPSWGKEKKAQDGGRRRTGGATTVEISYAARPRLQLSPGPLAASALCGWMRMGLGPWPFGGGENPQKAGSCAATGLPRLWRRISGSRLELGRRLPFGLGGVASGVSVMLIPFAIPVSLPDQS